MIDWKDISKDLIHGLVDGKVVIRMKRENIPPFLWEMTGISTGKSQFRNDLKEVAEHYHKKQQND